MYSPVPYSNITPKNRVFWCFFVIFRVFLPLLAGSAKTSKNQISIFSKIIYNSTQTGDPDIPFLTPILDPFLTLLLVGIIDKGASTGTKQGSGYGPLFWPLFWHKIGVFDPFLDHFWITSWPVSNSCMHRNSVIQLNSDTDTDIFWPHYRTQNSPFWPIFDPFLTHFWPIFDPILVHSLVLTMPSPWRYRPKPDQNRGSGSGPPVLTSFFHFFTLFGHLFGPLLDHFLIGLGLMYAS